MSMQQTQAFPNEEIELRASHKNLDGFTVRIYQAKKLIKEQHYSVIRPEDYRTQDTVFTFKAPELGAYVMRIIPDIRAKRDSESKFDVTRFKSADMPFAGQTVSSGDAGWTDRASYSPCESDDVQ